MPPTRGKPKGKAKPKRGAAAGGGRGRGHGRGQARNAEAAGVADVLAAPVEAPPAAPAAILAGAPGAVPSGGVNGTILVKVNNCIREILDHPAFEGVRTQEPHPMGAGLASQDPFNCDKCKLGFEHGGVYRASINMWAVDILRLPAPGVPIVQSAITRLRTHYFFSPRPLPLPLVLAADTAEHADAELMTHSAKMVSAPEMLFAFIEAVREDIKKADDTLLAKWRDAMLSTPVEYCCVTTTDEAHIMSVQYREDLSQAYASLRYSAIQKMYDIKDVMDRKTATTGATSAKAVAAYYQGIHYSENSERVTFEFVDCALTVLRRMVCIPRCTILLSELEEEGCANPLDSIYKLHKIVTRAQSADKIEWTLELMIDMWRSGGYKSDQYSVRHLDGKGTAAAGKGIVELMGFKQDLLKHLVGDFLDARQICNEDKHTLRGVCASLAVFRERCGYVHNNKYRKAADCCWWQCPPDQLATSAITIIAVVVGGNAGALPPTAKLPSTTPGVT